MDKWLPTVWQIANCKNGVSSWEIHRAIGVTQKTAWFMLQRIRLAMQDESGGKVHTTVISNRKKKTLQAEVHKHVEAGSALYTDELLSYKGLEGR